MYRKNRFNWIYKLHIILNLGRTISHRLTALLRWCIKLNIIINLSKITHKHRKLTEHNRAQRIPTSVHDIKSKKNVEQKRWTKAKKILFHWIKMLESNSATESYWTKIHCVNPIQRTYPTSTKKKGKDPYLGSLNQGFLFSGQDGGSGGAKEKDIKGTIRYGAKTFSEKKRMRGKNIFVSIVGRTSALVH